MSGVVMFSDGGRWSVGRRGWNKLQERTVAKLVEAGHGDLEDEIQDYGVGFDPDRDGVRTALAAALLEAAREVQVESGAAEGWDPVKQGPYFGELVALLERELAKGGS